MHNHLFAGVSLAALLAAAPGAVFAQTQRAGGGEAQKFMQQYQQIAAEKTALQAQVTQLKKDLDAAKAELITIKGERDAAKARAGGSTAAIAQAASARQASEKSLEQSKQKTNELVVRFRDIAANLKEVETDRTKLRRDLAEREAAFDKCAAANLQLYEINGQILDRYEHVGLFTKVSASEPFTKLSRTRIENLVDEYRERARELRAKAPAP